MHSKYARFVHVEGAPRARESSTAAANCLIDFSLLRFARLIP